MSFKNSSFYVACISVLIFNIYTAALGPLIPVLVAGGVSALLAGYGSLRCRMFECCSDDWTKPNISGLHQALNQRVHGQHLVIDPLVKAIKSHTSNPNPQKALVLSFHGWTGSGKNFVAQILADHLFKKGTESKYYHLVASTLHFRHESLLETYKDQLHDLIRRNVLNCPRSLFVFDEMDKMPASLIDTLKPYLDFYPAIDGVSYNKAIFIFISDTAGNDIVELALDHWKTGGKREDIKFKTMEDAIIRSALSEKGGLWHSALIKKNLISAFIPFLPMERKHVKLCIKDQLIAMGHPLEEEFMNKVASELTYFPKDGENYSTSGCKRVAEKVAFIMEDVTV